MNGEVNGVFIYNGQPQNGATAQLWKIVGFASYADSTDEVENNPIAATDIELDVNNGALFAVGDVIKIGTEVLRITLISTNKLYVIRGYRGTTPAIHAQNTQIDDETITEPAQDTAVPAGSQQGGDVTTGVAYGGDGAYRWTAVPEGEYYVSVTYDAHIAWLYVSVEVNDATPEQILTLDGDVFIHNADGVTRLPIGAAGQYLKVAGTGRPAWQAAIGEASITIADTNDVHNGASPVAFTDLDLSAVVGTAAALVFLKVAGGADETMCFRRNGDADDHYGANASGANIADNPNVAMWHLVLVHTDTSGIIEWKCSNANARTIDVVAYIV